MIQSVREAKTEIGAMNQPAVRPDANPVWVDASPSRPRWFFVGMSAALLAIVLAGFARTFFLREYFGTAQLPTGLQTLPALLHVHGIVLTSWFVLFLVQTTLIASRHTDIHRRLGVAGAILAIVVVVVSLMVNIRAIPRSPANGLSAAELPGLIGANIASLLNFSVLAASGIYLRRRPETHKRLMLLASISIIGPALSRIPGVHEFPVLYLVGMLSLFIALPLYDIVRNRRVHPATAWAAIVNLDLDFRHSGGNVQRWAIFHPMG
jgi:hypothetical protein